MPPISGTLLTQGERAGTTANPPWSHTWKKGVGSALYLLWACYTIWRKILQFELCFFWQQATLPLSTPGRQLAFS